MAWEDSLPSDLLTSTQDWTAGLQHTDSVLLLASYSSKDAVLTTYL